MQDEISRRAELYLQGEIDREFALAQMRLCWDDPVYFFNNYLWTYDPRTADKDLAFALYPFQEHLAEKLVGAVQDRHDLLIAKPRDMGASFTCLGTILWGWRFWNWDGRVGSRKEEYVDTKEVMDALFPKLRYMFYRLPKWMLPAGFNPRLHDTYMRLVNPEGGVIVGEATNPHFGRGGRSNVTLFDEFAAWECDHLAWESSGDTTPSRWGISTLGRDPACKFNALRREWMAERPEWVVNLRWDMHPNKTEAWYENEKSRRDAREFAIDIDCHESEAGGAVFDSFRTTLHYERVHDLRQLFRAGWVPREALDPHDARASVLVVGVLSPDGKTALIVRDYKLDGNSLDQTREQIEEVRKELGYYRPDRLVIDARHGARKHKSAYGEYTWETYFVECGEPVELSYSDPGSIEYGHKIIKDWLRYDDGPPKLKVDPVGAAMVAEAFERYSYDEKGKVRLTYKDPMDCVRYFITPGPPPLEFWKQGRTQPPEWGELVELHKPKPQLRRPAIDSLKADSILESGYLH